MILAAAVLSSLLAASAAGAPPVPSLAFFESHREKFLAKLPAGSIAVLPRGGRDSRGRARTRSGRTPPSGT